MFGIPAYSVNYFPNYQKEFNYQNIPDEMNTKLLLLMPLIPPKFHREIRLNHLRRSLNFEGRDINVDIEDEQEFGYEMDNQEQLRRSRGRSRKIVSLQNSSHHSKNPSFVGASGGVIPAVPGFSDKVSESSDVVIGERKSEGAVIELEDKGVAKDKGDIEAQNLEKREE